MANNSTLMLLIGFPKSSRVNISKTTLLFAIYSVHFFVCGGNRDHTTTPALSSSVDFSMELAQSRKSLDLLGLPKYGNTWNHNQYKEMCFPSEVLMATSMNTSVPYGLRGLYSMHYIVSNQSLFSIDLKQWSFRNIPVNYLSMGNIMYTILSFRHIWPSVKIRYRQDDARRAGQDLIERYLISVFAVNLWMFASVAGTFLGGVFVSTSFLVLMSYFSWKNDFIINLVNHNIGPLVSMIFVGPLVEESLKLCRFVPRVLFGVTEFVVYLSILFNRSIDVPINGAIYFSNRLACCFMHTYISNFNFFERLFIHVVFNSIGAYRFVIAYKRNECVSDFVDEHLMINLTLVQMVFLNLYGYIRTRFNRILHFRVNIQIPPRPMPFIRQAKHSYGCPRRIECNWFYDTIDYKRSEGETLKRVRRLYSDGQIELGKWAPDIRTAYQLFEDRFRREANEGYYDLRDLKIDSFLSKLVECIPYFGRECVIVLTLLFQMDQLRRTKANTKAFVTILSTTLFSNLSSLRTPDEIASFVKCIIEAAPEIYGHVKENTVNKIIDNLQEFKSEYNDYIKERNDLEYCRSRYYQRTTAAQQKKEQDDLDDLNSQSNLNRHLNSFVEPLANFIFERHAVEKEEKFNSGYRIVNQLVLVGSGLVALLTMPFTFNLHHLRSHLISSRQSVENHESVDILTFMWRFLTATQSLIMSLYFAISSGKPIESLFQNKLHEDYKKIKETQKYLSALSSYEITDKQILPYGDLYEYETALTTHIFEMSNGAGIFTDFERKNRLEELKNYRKQLVMEAYSTRPRVAPFVVCLYGASSIGKTSITNQLTGLYASCCGIKVNNHVNEGTYRHNPGSKHWDGLRSTHWCYFLDDIGREKDASQAPNGASNEALLDLVGNLPFPPPMADLPNKGNVFCRPRLVLMTTNNKTLGAHQNHACAVAVLRRVNYYIIPKLKEEFKLDGQLNSAKAAALPEQYCNTPWTFTVEKVTVVPNSTKPIVGDVARFDTVIWKHNNRDVVMQDVEWDTLSVFFAEQAQAQYSVQKHIVNTMNSSATKLKFCSNCDAWHTGNRNDRCFGGKGEDVEEPKVKEREVQTEFSAACENVHDGDPPALEDDSDDEEEIQRVKEDNFRRESLENLYYRAKWSFYQYFRKYPEWYERVLRCCVYESFSCHVNKERWIDEYLKSKAYSDLRYDLFKLKPDKFLTHLASHFRTQIKFLDDVNIGNVDLSITRVPFEFPMNKDKLDQNTQNFWFMRQHLDQFLMCILLVCISKLCINQFIVVFISLLIGLYLASRSVVLYRVYRTLRYLNFGGHWLDRRMVYYILTSITVALGVLCLYNYSTKKNVGCWEPEFASGKHTCYMRDKCPFYLKTLSEDESNTLQCERQGQMFSSDTCDKTYDWFGRSGVDNPEQHSVGDYSQQSKTSPGGTVNRDTFLQNIMHNTLLLNLTRSDGLIRTNIQCYGFAVDTNHFILNSHSLESRTTDEILFDTIEIFYYKTSGGKIRQRLCKLRLDSHNHIRIAPDVILVRTSTQLQKKDLKHYFHTDRTTGMSSAINFRWRFFNEYGPEDEWARPGKCDAIEVFSNGPTAYLQYLDNKRKIFRSHNDPEAIRDQDKEPCDRTFEEVWVIPQASEPSENGCSGSVWINGSNEAFSVIYGIHVGKAGDIQICGRVTYENLMGSIHELSKRPGIALISDVVQESYETHIQIWNCEGNEKVKIENITDVNLKSHAAWIGCNEIHPFVHSIRYQNENNPGCNLSKGKPIKSFIKETIPAGSSDMKWHITKEWWERRGIMTNKKIPHVKRFRKTSYAHGIKEINQIPDVVPQRDLNICAKHYLDTVVNNLDKYVDLFTKEFGLVDINSAINGIDGVQFIDGLNVKTSCGFPLYCKKSKYLERSVNGKIQDIPPWLNRRVDELVDIYKSGKRARPVFVAHLKDEFLSETKFNDGRLRVFMASPIDFTIVTRIFLLSFVRVMQKFRTEFECGVSIAAQSVDWSDLKEYLNQEGFNKFIAGDYKHYDKSMHFYVLNVSCSIIVEILQRSGKYDDNDLRCIKLILLDIINSIVDYDGTFLELFGSNPSGHPLTVLLNCIAGSIYIRIAYLRKYGNLDKFNDNIRVMTYGDDNVICVHDSCDFTFQDMRDGIKDLAIYTTADKQEEGSPYEEFKDVVFLKRKFLYNEFLSSIFERPMYTAPLEKDSINKMLLGGKGTLSPIEAVSASLKTALEEVSFHDSDTFNYYHKLIEECKQEFGIRDVKNLTQNQRLILIFQKDMNERQLAKASSYLESMGTDLKGLAEPDLGINIISSGEEFTRQAWESTETVFSFKTSANSFLKFDSAPVGEVSISKSTNISTNEDHIGDLSSFLSRPVKIDTFSWTEGTNLRHTFYPYHAYINTTAIKMKMLNYAKFRGDLVLDILVNANPFKYSAVVMAFKPLVGLTKRYGSGSGTVNYTATEYRDISGGVIDDELLKTPNDVLNSILMQRQHVMIYPQETTKCTMRIPFIWLQDHYPLLSSGGLFGDSFEDAYRLGKIDVSSLCPLFSTATASSNPITIEVFAHLENVTLCGPTLQREADEYDPSKPISSVASAVAESSGRLQDVPVIGPYATTASMFSRAIGNLASLFGYSNTNNVQPAHKMKPILASGWSNPNEMVPMVKLSLDQKNELSLDQSVIGLDRMDEMSIEHICAKPFLAGTMTWGDTLQPGDILCSGKICPSYFYSDTFTAQSGEQELLWPIPGVGSYNYKSLTLAPATWIAQHFQYWKGDMKIKIKILCSQFHKGRLRFIYDPNSILGTFSEAKVFSKIIDLNDDNECEINIPYSGYRPFLEIPNFSASSTATGVGDYLFSNPDRIFAKYGDNLTYYDNNAVGGSYQIQVMTDLSAPVAADAIVCLWVSFHNNSFMCPISPFRNNSDDVLESTATSLSDWSYKAPLQVARQSLESSAYLSEGSSETINITSYDQKKDLISGGEKVESIRTLLHRWGIHNAHISNTITLNTFKAWFQAFKYRFPIYHGSNLLANDLSESSYRYCIGGSTPINYFTPAFVAWKGGINWRCNIKTFINEDALVANAWATSSMVPDQMILSRTLMAIDRAPMAEQIRLTNGPNLNSTLINERFKRTILNQEQTQLYFGGEICQDLGGGTVQQMEVTCPDYCPDRASPANQYLNDATTNTESITTNGRDGSFLKWFFKRDQIRVTGFLRAPNGYFAEKTGDSPENQRALLRTYCCAAPDFSLMGFLNVPTIYVHEDLTLPEYDSTP